MRFQKFVALWLLVVFLSAFVAVEGEPLVPDIPADASPHLIGNVLTIYDFENEISNPEIAYSDKTNHYLVVYQDNNDLVIKGRFVDATTGSLTGGVFNISSSNADEQTPDVVYDPDNDVFLVVYSTWTYTTNPSRKDALDMEIAIKGVLVEEPELIGSANVHSASGPNEFTIVSPWPNDKYRSPKVAYNQADNQYLVVFLSGTGEWVELNQLKGQMLNSHPTLPTRIGPDHGFPISNTTGSFHSLDVAWSQGSGGGFLTVAAETDTRNPGIATRKSIEAFYLYGTYVGSGGSQVNIQWRIAPKNPLTKFCHRPVLAYDASSHSFTVVFNYGNNKEDDEDWTVYGQRLDQYTSSIENPLIGKPIPIEIDLSKYTRFLYPAITHSGPDDVMHVVYQANKVNPGPNNDDNDIYLRSLQGSRVSVPITVRKTQPGSRLYENIIGGSNPGHSLVVWGEEVANKDENTLGQRIGTINLTYLPSVFNPIDTGGSG